MLMLCFSLFATAASAEEGSPYIGHYMASMGASNNGVVSITFQITGTGMMDQIGATRITIYENNVAVQTLVHTSTPGMMVNNHFIHANSYTYNGVIGRTYWARVTFQAGKGGDCDNRSLNSNSVVAR